VPTKIHEPPSHVVPYIRYSSQYLLRLRTKRSIRMATVLSMTRMKPTFLVIASISTNSCHTSLSAPFKQLKCRVRSTIYWRYSSPPVMERDEETGDLFFIDHFQSIESEDLHRDPSYHFRSITSSGSRYVDEASSHEDVLQDLTLLPGRQSHRCSYFKNDIFKRVYIPTASASFDFRVISRDNQVENQTQGIRLAIGPRPRACSKNARNEQVGISRKSDRDERSDYEIYQFPSEDAPEPLKELLMPSCHRKRMLGCAFDARTMIFMTECGNRRHGHESRIMLLNFDPWIRFEGLERSFSQSLVDRSSLKEYESRVVNSNVSFKWDKNTQRRARAGLQTDAQFGSETNGLQIGHNQTKAQVGSVRSRLREVDEKKENHHRSHAKSAKLPWFRTEPACWLNYKSGFNFKSTAGAMNSV